MIKAIIFDLDGTIIDSMEHWNSLDECFLRENGIEPPAGISQVLKRLTSETAAIYLQERFFPDQTVRYIQNGINQMMLAKYFQASLKAKVREFLQICRSQGIRLCIATATDHVLMEPTLKQKGLFHLFDFVLTCDDVGCGKQESVIYDEAVKRLGVQQHEVVIFEDALHCIETAKRAGYQVVGIYDKVADMDGESERIKELCDRYILSFDELLVEN